MECTNGTNNFNNKSYIIYELDNIIYRTRNPTTSIIIN